MCVAGARPNYSHYILTNMTNVLDITPHLPEHPALDVDLPLAIVRRLAQVGKISRHALGIGAVALSRMQQNAKYSCELTRQDFFGTYVSLDGEPFASATNPEIHELAGALHSLQAYCGLYNHVKSDRVGKGTVRYNHFTEKYRGDGDYELLCRVLKHSTPVYFVWLPDEADELVREVKEMIEHKMLIAQWANITTTNKGC